MPKFKPYLLGTFCGAGLMFVAMRYHVVRSAEGVVLVPRSPQPPIRSSYVDVREWGASMWKQYPEVATALVADGRGKLVAEGVAKDLLRGPSTEPGNAGSAGESEGPLAEARRETPAPLKLKSLFSQEAGEPGPAAWGAPSMGAIASVGVDERTFTAQSAANPTEDLSRRTAPETPTGLRSVLDELFAPYGTSGPPPATAVAETGSGVGATAPANVRLSIPTSSVPAHATSTTAPAAPTMFMDLRSLDVELGQPGAAGAFSGTPRQAGTPDSLIRDKPSGTEASLPPGAEAI